MGISNNQSDYRYITSLVVAMAPVLDLILEYVLQHYHIIHMNNIWKWQNSKNIARVQNSYTLHHGVYEIYKLSSP